MRNLAGTKIKVEGSSNGHDDSDVTSNGGNGTVIRRRNDYERSVNEPKRMNGSSNREKHCHTTW
jgi:hypothetical protein